MGSDLYNWSRGDRIGDFTVQRFLGEGWEAVVLLVKDRRDGQLRTLKLFKRVNVMAEVLHTVKHWEKYTGLASVKQVREYGVLKGQRRVSERPWMLMDYIRGPTLAEKIKRGQIRDPTALAIMLLEALVPVHKRFLSIGDLDSGANVVIAKGKAVFIDLDAGGTKHPPPEIREDLQEVLNLVRACSTAGFPMGLNKVLTAPETTLSALRTLRRQQRRA